MTRKDAPGKNGRASKRRSPVSPRPPVAALYGLLLAGSAESWEVLLTMPVRVLLNRHPERGFAGRDLAQAFLGPGAKLTAVLHFEAGESLPPGFLELFDEFQIDLSGLENSFRVSGFGLKAGSTLRYIADRVIADDLEVKVLAICGIRKDGSKEKLYTR